MAQKEFTLQADTLSLWHEQTLHVTQDCLFCQRNFQEIAAYLNESGLTVSGWTDDSVTVYAGDETAADNQGWTIELKYLYALLSAKAEKERTQIISDGWEGFSITIPLLIKSNKPTFNTPTAQRKAALIGYFQRLHKRHFKQEAHVSKDVTIREIYEKIQMVELEIQKKQRRLQLDIENEQVNNPKKVKASFKGWLEKHLSYRLAELDYPFTDFSEMTEEFLVDLQKQVVTEKQNSYANTIWLKSDFIPEKDELRKYTEQVMKKLKEKTATDSQIEYFYTLCEELSLEKEPLPDNYLIFSKRMKAYKDQAAKHRPATPKQIYTVTKLWKRFFKEEIDVSAATQAEISTYFDIINSRNN